MDEQFRDARLTLLAKPLVALCVLALFLLSPPGLSADSITAYFNSPPESDGLTQAVTDVIDGAEDYVYLTAYSMNAKPVVNSLIDAHERDGVTVRVITEKDNLEKGGSYSGFSSAYDKLSSNGVTVKADDKSSLMHHKFVVVDDEAVITGSTNLTEKQLNGDKNNMIKLESSSVAYHYKQEFLEMWSGDFSNDKTNDPIQTHTVDGHTVTTAFSPGVDGTDQILDVLSDADVNVFFSIFTFTHETIADRLIQLHNHGVNVRGTMDAWQADDSYYVAQIFDKLTGESVPVRMDSYHGLLHNKYMVIDGQTNSDPTLITGSYNWTASANESNDENFVIVRDHPVVDRYYEEARETYLDHAEKPDWQAPLSGVVNVNKADEETLTRLNGIGSVTAGAIVTYRSNNGPFRRIEELKNVDGIGPATIQQIESYVSLGEHAGLVDLNTADAGQLEILDGIGPVTAQAIIDDRSTNGDFGSVDDLTRVDGVGPATLSGIRDDVKVTSTEPELINVNTASADTLATLDGIGPVTATNMVSYRSANGDFPSKDQLINVDGIGPETLDGIRPDVTIGETGSSLLNVNEADTTTLDQLDGIGTVTAQKIVAERTVNGDFVSVDDLTRVDGIGTATIDNFRDKVTVGKDQLININNAEQSVLESLSGIGPVTAQSIIDYRSSNGGFSSKSDLKKVDGIGEITYQMVKDKITT